MDRKKIVREAARRLFRKPSVDAVLLVGSVARGIESSDSDIDLALFTDDEPDSFIRTSYVGDALLEVDFYSTKRAPTGPATPLLSLQDLREAGRLGTGEILYSRWRQLDRSRTAWLAAMLAPAETIRLLSVAAAYLDRKRLETCRSEADRIWMVQGAASALAVLAVSLLPCRFQKPKWMIHDLKEAGLIDLASCIRALYFVRLGKTLSIEEVLRIAETRLQAGLDLGGLPPLKYGPNIDERCCYIYRTYADALSLQRDGDREGSAYTACYALRLLNALLQEGSATSGKATDGAVDQWRRTSVECLFGGVNIEEVIDSLSDSGRKLQEEYQRRYGKSQPFEAVAEGSWRARGQLGPLEQRINQLN